MTKDGFEIISKYTSKQAVGDKILFDVVTVNPEWKKGIFSHITTNLLREGYVKEDGEINIPNLLDLLNQANQIVKKKSKNFKKFDWFFEGEIELPSGSKRKIFIAQNETGKFTIMLPEDY